MITYEASRSRVLSRTSIDPFGCVLWTGQRDRKGYGRTRWGGRKQLAHRVVYEIFNGPVPEGLELDHLCGVPSCVSPAHLEPTTHQGNIISGHQRRGLVPEKDCPHCGVAMKRRYYPEGRPRGWTCNPCGAVKMREKYRKERE